MRSTPSSSFGVLEARGVPLAFEQHGPVDAPPFMWLHGLTSGRAHEDKTRLFDWTSVDGVRLTRYDARGHGASGGTDDDTTYRWDELALDLFAVLDALGIERTVVGGASMGAATTLHAVLRQPERFTKLVLVIPPTAWATRAAQADIYRAGADLVEQSGTEALAGLIRIRPPFATFGPRADELLETSAQAIEALDPVLLPHVMRGAASSDLPPLDQLATIEQPTLILAWHGDPGHPVETATALADTMPHATFHLATSLAEIETWPARIQDFLGRR